MIRNNRSLIVYILLTLITCGIYHWIFMYCLIEDVNAVCEGDGSVTPGLLTFILLSIVTCGIYGWYWYYKLGNRMAANAPRYNLQFTENGTTILLWMLLGSFVCGLGAFVAWYILINNMNALARGYNQMYYGSADYIYTDQN